MSPRAPQPQPDRTAPAWLAGAMLAVLVCGTVAVLLWAGEPIGPPASPARPIPVPPPPTVDLDAVVPLLPRDAIPAIDDPRFGSVVEARQEMAPDERVLGLVINGDARAYPINILSSHEVVNDVVGGEPVAITWCPLCYTALTFSRRIAPRDRPLTFGVSGRLLHNTLIMYDRETESLWSQLYGAAIDGPLAGETLAVFPSRHLDWETWAREHPGSRVLSKSLTCEQFACSQFAGSPGAGYGVDRYASYYNSPEEGVVDAQIPREGELDSRKRRVLGVRVGGRAIAYPYGLLREEPVVNDTVGGVPVLVWFDPDSESGAAYLREADGRALTFERKPGEPVEIVVDRETGSRWDASRGRAVSGPLQGQRLDALVSTPAFEFGWFGYFPESERYAGAGS